MQFGFWPNASQAWPDILDGAAHAEQTGWDSVWIADHFLPFTEDTSGPVHECWALLAGLAVAVPRVRLGSLVVGNTYRHPAVLAKQAASVDHLSGGRLVLGLGAGWQENEHVAYGIEYSTVQGRLDRLEEACAVITSLLRQDRSTSAGTHYQLQDAPLAPKPVGSLPLLIGGGGEQRTLRIAAQYADEWNTWGRTAHHRGHAQRGGRHRWRLRRGRRRRAHHPRLQPRPAQPPPGHHGAVHDRGRLRFTLV